MKQPYNILFRPPAPFPTVCLYSFITDTFTPLIAAMVDTGSDASLVPLSRLIQLGAEETAPGWLISITGERKLVSLFFVDVHIGDRILAGIRVIGEPDSTEVILGRDVLNHLPLFLDGPELLLSVPDEKDVVRLRRE